MSHHITSHPRRISTCINILLYSCSFSSSPHSSTLSTLPQSTQRSACAKPSHQHSTNTNNPGCQPPPHCPHTHTQHTTQHGHLDEHSQTKCKPSAGCLRPPVHRSQRRRIRPGRTVDTTNSPPSPRTFLALCTRPRGRQEEEIEKEEEDQ